MSKVSADVYIVPLGTYSPSISDYVAACEEVLKAYPNIKYQINPMSTTLEGELEVILEIVRRMHEAPFRQGAMRVSTSIRIDDRRDVDSSLEHKVEVVREKAHV